MTAPAGDDEWSAMTATDGYILTLQCRNRPGIVAAVATRLTRCGGDIRDAQQFDDDETGNFFMRVHFRMQPDASSFAAAMEEPAREFEMDWSIDAAGRRQRVLLMVSRFDHCLGDLLYRMRIDELDMEAVGIVSNHPKEALNVTIHESIRYHHLPVTRETKPQQEGQIRRIVEETGAELVVLARYMQILSDEMSEYLSGRCINIHHSFLPGFKGAKPYHQAHARGVKMIGATAHYVTGDLDEGPIIHQDVARVTHRHGVADLVRKGRDLEKLVLAQAVRWHLEGRVLVYGNKTVVFD